MKTPSDELFLLIKSLNSQEKAQFKVYASRRKENSNYIQLFDAIDLQEIYDEEQLKKSFKKASFIKYLYRIKPYIQESILKCLQEYYAPDSVDAVLCNHKQQIEILLNKRLFTSAKKLVEKAEKFAIENHQFLHQIDILLFKQRIMIMESNIEGLKHYQQEWYFDVLDCIEKYKNIIEYKGINTPVIIHIITQFENLNAEAVNELNSMAKDSLLKDERNALSYPAKLRHHLILGEIGLLLKNYKKSYIHFKKAVSYFEPARLNPNERLHIYNKLSATLCILQNQEELSAIKDEAGCLIRSLPKKLQTNDFNVYRHYLSIMNNYISYHLSVFNLQEALNSGDDIQAIIEKHATVQVFMVYYTNRFMIYFIQENYRKALLYSNKVLFKEKEGIRLDIISCMKILDITVHYELGNEDMLPKLCKSAAVSLEKYGSLNEAEKILLNFFGKIIIKVGNKSERKKMFSELKIELRKYKTENIIEFFDFISWAESKIENRALLDVLKEKLDNSLIR